MNLNVKLGNLPLPVTLHVNNESRTETLKHYCVVFRQDSPYRKIKNKAAELLLCFDPAKDSLYLPIISIGLEPPFK
jgi:hypothetical protein